jgi:hypothetical protein
MELRYSWNDRSNGAKGVEATDINALHAHAHYGDLYDEMQHASQEGAQMMARNARAIVTFADTANLKASESFKLVFGWSYDAEPTIDQGFDHTRLWFRARQYLITTEPYGSGHEKAAAWCRDRGWIYHVFPAGIGLWNPTGGTRMILCSPARNGLDIAPLIAPVEAALRACV